MRVTAAVALGATLALWGCGQKGPLYLPDKSAGVVTTSAPAQTAPERVPVAEPTSVPQPAPVPQPQSAPEPAAPAPQKKDNPDGEAPTPR
jgi:predicted small lipoprotein YifL